MFCSTEEEEEGMSKKMVTRRELLDRWRGIEEEDEDDDIASVDPLKRHRFRQLKEEWSCSQFHQNYIFPIFTCALVPFPFYAGFQTHSTT